MKFLHIQGLEVLLLVDFEEDLHRVSVIVYSGEAREISLDLIPIPTEHQFFKVLQVEKQTTFLFKPEITRRD